MSTFTTDLIEWYVAGETLAARDAVYVSDGNDGRTAGRVYKLDVTNADRNQFAGFSKDAAASAGDSVRVAIAGGLKGFTGLVEGKPVWASTTVAGGYQTTIPETSEQVQVLGTAKSATELVINAALAASFGANIGASGGGAGVGDVDTLALVTAFDDSLGLTEDTSVNGATFRLTHDGSVTQYAERTLEVTPKFRGKNLRLFTDILTTAASGNFKLIITDETNTVTLVDEVLTPQSGTLPEKRFVTFDTASDTASIKVRFEALAESGSPTSDFDDVVIQLTKSEKKVSEVYELEENEFSARIANDGTATVTSQSSPFIQSVNRSALGVVDIVFIPGFFTQPPSITSVVELNDGRGANPYNITSSGFSILTTDSANNPADNNSSFHISRQGTDRKDLTRRVERTVSSYNELVVKQNDSMIELNTRGSGTSGYGSVNTAIPRFTNLVNTFGSDITYQDSATDGASFLINTSGVYDISFTGAYDTNGQLVGISRNSTQLTININGINRNDRLASNIAVNAGDDVNCSWSGYLEAGDIIRPHDLGSASVTVRNERHQFTIAKSGTLDLAQTIPDSKIEIPSSEVRMEGASAVGSGTEAGTIQFTSLAKIRGNALEISNSNGTLITAKKDGKLHIDASVYQTATTSRTLYISKNSATPASDPLTNEIVAVSVITSSNSGGTSCTVDVKAGDIIRFRFNGGTTPVSTTGNFLQVRHEETKIAVAVTNIQPQFEDADSNVRLDTANGYGSTATKIRRFSNVRTNVGEAITYIDSATDGASFVINEDGVYNISYSDRHSGAAGPFFGLSLNASSLTSNINLLAADEILSIESVNGVNTNDFQTLAWTGKLSAGDVVRPHSTGDMNGTTLVSFSISKAGKPSIATADLTPFVKVPQVISQSLDYNQSLSLGIGAGALIDIPSLGLINIQGSNILSVTDEGSSTRFTALTDVTINTSISVTTGVANSSISIYKNGIEFIKGTSNGVDSAPGGGVGHFKLVAGEYFEYYYLGSATTITQLGFNIIAQAQELERVTNIDQTENHFAARIASGATIISQSGPSDWIDSVVSGGAGIYNVTFTSGFFTEAPSMTVSPAFGSTVTSWAEVHSITTTGCVVRTGNDGGGGLTNTEFSLKASRQGSDYKSIQDVAAVLFTPKVAYLKDVKPSGTAGGTFTASSWQTRELNTIEGDSEIVSLSSNQFTLQPGKYSIEGSAPVYGVVAAHQSRLRNITGSATSFIGTSDYNAASTSSGRSDFGGVIEIVSPATFEIQHFCNATQASTGFGLAVSSGEDEVYTTVKITKLS